MKQALNKAKQAYSNAPPVVQYAAIGVGLFLTYKMYKLLFKSDQEKGNAVIQAQNDKELAAYIKQTKLTFAPSQYSAFANVIYEGTKYGIGDNYGSVVDTLKKLKNNADVAMLVKAYGSRQNYVFGIPAGEKRDLFTNIKAELGSEYGGLTSYRINQINTDWQKKGITYKV